MKALSFPFSLTPSSQRIAETATYDQIVRGQIVDALMTNRGERVMRPRHGCDIQAALFDPSDLLERSDAASLLKSRLENLVPRAIVRDVSIDNANGEVIITVVYRPTPYAEDTNLAVPVASEYINRQTTQRSLPA